METVCILDGLFFKAGATIDFRALFGADFVPYNEVTDEAIHLGSDGTFRPEAGAIYSVHSASEFKKVFLGKASVSCFNRSSEMRRYK